MEKWLSILSIVQLIATVALAVVIWRLIRRERSRSASESKMARTVWQSWNGRSHRAISVTGYGLVHLNVDGRIIIAPMETLHRLTADYITGAKTLEDTANLLEQIAHAARQGDLGEFERVICLASYLEERATELAEMAGGESEVSWTYA